MYCHTLSQSTARGGQTRTGAGCVRVRVKLLNYLRVRVVVLRVRVKKKIMRFCSSSLETGVAVFTPVQIMPASVEVELWSTCGDTVLVE